jgi:pimeloyl-ACP methyl ester carboxylesterase
VDFAAYNGAAIARDLADLRQVLGYDAWNLVGVSYGSRTALVTARDAPAGLRAMVLDGVTPPGLKLVETDPVHMAAMLRAVLNACAANQPCNAAWPDLTQRFEAALSEWTTPKALARRGARDRMEELSFFLGVTLYDPVGVANLPADLAAILDGDRSQIEATNERFDGAAAGSIMGHYCSEIMPFETYDGMQGRAAADPIAKALAAVTDREDFEGCDQWPTGPVRQIEARPVTSTVPALLMSAALDPGTPPSNAVFAARTLSRAQLVVSPTGTHGISFSTACGRSIMHAFLAAPGVPVDTRCLGDEQTGVQFVLPDQ